MSEEKVAERTDQKECRISDGAPTQNAAGTKPVLERRKCEEKPYRLR